MTRKLLGLFASLFHLFEYSPSAAQCCASVVLAPLALELERPTMALKGKRPTLEHNRFQQMACPTFWMYSAMRS